MNVMVNNAIKSMTKEHHGGDKWDQVRSHLHARAGSVMPEFRHPLFKCEKVERQTTKLHYYSDISGLDALVIDMFKGLAKRFDQSCDIVKIAAKGEDYDYDVFEILSAA